MGYTHVEFMPVAEHPFDGSWGYQTVGYFAPTSRFGTPTRLHVPDRHAAPARHRRDSRLGPRPLSARRARPGLLRRHAPLRARRPAQGEHPNGARSSSITAGRGSNFLISNALFWLDKYHVDGLRVDAVASMLYLDYAQEAGEWLPNQFGGRENLEAIAFLHGSTSRSISSFPDTLMIAEESTAWPMVSRPT